MTERFCVDCKHSTVRPERDVPRLRYGLFGVTVRNVREPETVMCNRLRDLVTGEVRHVEAGWARFMAHPWDGGCGREGTLFEPKHHSGEQPVVVAFPSGSGASVEGNNNP